MDFGLSSLNSDMGSNGDYDLEYSDPDACLNPVDRLEKYVESEHMYSRQLAARSLLETLQQVDDFSDAERVLNVLTTLANDADGVVRTELCEQLAHIGTVCTESRTIFTSGDTSYDPLSSDILPIIYRYMTDPNNQVRKTSQTALAELVEQGLVTNDDVVSRVSPIISRLADMDSSEDHRSEAASLLCRLVPIVGAELTEQLFLDLFLNFCTDHTFQIRKICAVNFGSICQVVGCEKTESLLLKKFFSLCTDAIWGVRKACTECFMQVSLICSPSVRHSQLSAVFINLIADQSRWVRMAAFEALGGFISTFANPDATGLRLTDDGTIVVADPSDLLDEKRAENVREIVNDLKEESAVILDSAIVVASEFQPAIAMNSDNISTSSNSGQMSGNVDDKPLHISDSCRNEAVSNFAPQDSTVYADNDVDALNELTGVDRSEIAADNQIVCNGEHSDETESELIDSSHTQEPDECKTLSTPQKVFENGVEESEDSGGVISENGPGEEVRWNLNGTVDQSVDTPGDKTEDALEDESPSVNCHAVTSAVENCQLTNGLDSTAAVDTCALDDCLGSDVIRTAADDVTQQFGSLNFWQKMVSELSETSRQEDLNDAIMQQTENSPFSSFESETTPAAQNLLNSKLLGSISHLCDSVVAVSETIAANHMPLTNVVENGDVVLHGESDGDVQESNNMQNAKLSIEIFKPEAKILARSVESAINSIAPVECDDGSHAEAATDPETPLSTLDTDEIPEFTGTGRHKVSRPLLQLMDDSTDTKSTSVDVEEAVDLENGIDVDEEEICELVAAAKDMPCDDIAIYEQDVVPSDLLEQYLSMMDPSCAQKVDSEITRHCAYSLPAVAYTLGRKNWSSLKNLYRTLATDVQWKVRRTLAFSIHELALIVGEEITSRDLVPVFDGFLNDLDEVRIGVLKHLADFLKLLPVETRCVYLLKITELLKTDNSRNWRFREELARQLFLLLGLFTVADIQEHISPIALHLAQDRVAQVRLAAVRVLSHILKQLVKHVEGDEGRSVWTSYLEKLDEQFARSETCSRRQMYVQLCSCILQDGVISNECFAEKFLPTLLSLRHDAIPNVRLTLARTIAQHIKHSEFFSSSESPHHKDVRQAIALLEEDKDRDVRFLIKLKPNDVVEHSSDEIEA